MSIEATSNVGTKSYGSVDLAQIRNESRYAGTPRNVRFGSKADIRTAKSHVCFSPEGGHSDHVNAITA
jgi:hypothetical protein